MVKNTYKRDSRISIKSDLIRLCLRLKHNKRSCNVEINKRFVIAKQIHFYKTKQLRVVRRERSKKNIHKIQKHKIYKMNKKIDEDEANDSSITDTC